MIGKRPLLLLMLLLRALLLGQNRREWRKSFLIYLISIQITLNLQINIDTSIRGTSEGTMDSGSTVTD